MWRTQRPGTWLASAAVLGLGVTAVVQAGRHPAESMGGGNPATLTFELTAGLGVWAAGLFLARWRSALLPGVMLAATGPALFLAMLPLPGDGGALLFTLALAGGTLTPAVAGTAALLHLRAVPRFPDMIVALAAFATSWLWIGIARAVAFDPQATGCFRCPQNLLHVGASASMADAVARDGFYAATICCSLLALLSLLRWARLPALLREMAAPVVLGGAGAAALGAVAFAHEATFGFRIVDTTTRSLWLSMCGLVGVAATGVAVAAFRDRLQSQRIAGLVLKTLPSSDALRATLADSLGDPDLALVFPRDDGTLVDAQGRPVGPPLPDVAIVDVTQGNSVVAQVRHRMDLVKAPGRLSEVARGAGLALQHASLRAQLRAELADLTASRTRVVEIGDAERRRLERNLHDGAQQRLIALSVSLQAAAPNRRVRGHSHGEIQRALDSLRVLARGIHPVSLTDAGLDAAIRELAEESRVPLRLETLPQQRSPMSAEAAVYRLVLDGVRCVERLGDGRAVVVSIDRAPDSLHAHLIFPGVGTAEISEALQHVADRYTALEGSLTIRRERDGVIVDGQLPCVS